ncbi:hypothetical protein ACFLZ2_04090 [Candidatus Margulisiibacteriota bacterium]
MIPRGRPVGGQGNVNGFGRLQQNSSVSKQAYTTPSYLLNITPHQVAHLSEADFQALGPDAMARYSEDVLKPVIDHGILKMNDETIAAIPLHYVTKIRPIDLTYKVIHALTLAQFKVLTQAQIRSLDQFTLKDLDFDKKSILVLKGGLSADQVIAMLGSNANEQIAQIKRADQATKENI